MDTNINQKMNILSALGMILVVAGHTGFSFSDWFPIFSFHMALFMFISGYFFKDRPFKEFFIKKIKHLLIPLLLWNAVYGVIINLLSNNGLTQLYHENISIKTLLWDPFTMGWQFNFNAPTWFVGTLFLVQIIYWAIYQGSKKKITVIWGLSIGLYFISLYGAFHGYTQYDDFNALNNAKLGASRAFFCVIFYHLGYIYHVYFDQKDTFSVGKVIGLFMLNSFLLGFISPQIWMDIRPMYFPVHKYWLPIVEACSGIWLFLQIVTLLRVHIKNDGLISYIGRHTFAIMTHQQFFFWIVNTILFALTYFDIYTLDSFDYNLYMKDIYYRIPVHPPVNRLMYLIAGIMGPVVCCWLYEKYAKAHVLRFRRNLLLHIDKIRSGGLRIYNNSELLAYV